MATSIITIVDDRYLPAAIIQSLGHSPAMLDGILKGCIPLQPVLVDLIEQAFLEAQIDGQKADLAYLWLRGKQLQFRTNCYP